MFQVLGWVGLIFIFYRYFFPIIILNLRIEESFCFSNDTRGPLPVALPFPFTGFPFWEIIPISKIKFGHNFHLLSVVGFWILEHTRIVRMQKKRCQQKAEFRKKKAGISPGLFNKYAFNFD
jgi:hypothetical protein